MSLQRRLLSPWTISLFLLTLGLMEISFLHSVGIGRVTTGQANYEQFDEFSGIEITDGVLFVGRSGWQQTTGGRRVPPQPPTGESYWAMANTIPQLPHALPWEFGIKLRQPHIVRNSYFRRPFDSTLGIPLWMFFLLFLYRPASKSIRDRLGLGVHSTRCQQCGYDLRASPVRCPECGIVRTVQQV